MVRQSDSESSDDSRDNLDTKEDEMESKTVKPTKPYFNPLKEHMSWNPVLVKEERELTEPAEVGWKIVLKMVQNKLKENDTNSVKNIGRTSSVEQLDSLHRVRMLLDQW